MKKAIDGGAQAIELDVQLTKDKELVVIHDQRLKRFNSNYPGLIKDYTLAEIKQIDVGSVFSDAYKGTTLATLQEILNICPDDLVINIEIKNIPIIYEGIEEVLLACLDQNKRLTQIIISSFDHLALEIVQSLNPALSLGLLLY